MSFDFKSLPWLSPPPSDFTARRRALLDLDSDQAASELRALSGFALSAAQASNLRRAAAVLSKRDGGIAGLASVRLAVLAGSTFDLVQDHFAAAAARHGVHLDLTSVGFDQVEPAAFDPYSPVNAARPDAVLLAVDHRWLRLDRFLADGAQPAVDEATRRLEALASALVRNSGATPIFCTVPAPVDSVFGSFDRRAPGSPASLVQALNERVLDLAARFYAPLLDVAALAARIGLDAWFDADAWFGAKLSFSPVCDAAYADQLGRLLGALRGRARKALVLDLDNTLWGGVLGDDGPDALRLGPGDPIGEAFASIQAYALDLQRRGILLAISSKNDEAAARNAFAHGLGMVLKPDHISVFHANWHDKPSNLKAIAQSLNLGVDALVLLDDNPAERAQVRAALPAVAVPELPSEPAFFVRTLAAAGYFEAVAFTAADLARAADVSARSARAEVKSQFRDLGDYLADLEMRMTVGRFDAASRARIAQLINKTNQFNLTNRRRTEAEVASLEGDPRAVTLRAHLADRFGDAGMISVLIATEATHHGEPALEIDTWLMSCRVLGRGVEDALFAALLDTAKASGARWLLAAFCPSEKNTPVADLLPRLGMVEARRSQSEIAYAARLEDLPCPRFAIAVTHI